MFFDGCEHTDSSVGVCNTPAKVHNNVRKQACLERMVTAGLQEEPVVL